MRIRKVSAVQQRFYGSALPVAIVMSTLVKSRGKRSRRTEVRPNVPA